MISILISQSNFEKVILRFSFVSIEIQLNENKYFDFYWKPK